MTNQGQGHSLTFVHGHSEHCQTSFPKNIRPFEARFIMESPWDVGMNICSNVPGHMTKMSSRPIHGNSNISFFGTKRMMTLKLGIHRVLKYK